MTGLCAVMKEGCEGRIKTKSGWWPRAGQEVLEVSIDMLTQQWYVPVPTCKDLCG